MRDRESARARESARERVREKTCSRVARFARAVVGDERVDLIVFVRVALHELLRHLYR